MTDVPDYYGQMQRDREGLFNSLDRGTTPPPREFNVPGYRVVGGPNFGFYQLSPPHGQEIPNQNWKFHLSIHGDDVARAWNIVVDELINDDIPHSAKVVRPVNIQRFSDPDYIQAGKMITIYTSDDIPVSQYEDLMRRIEQRFLTEGIRTGPLSNADRLVPGSSYASYRRENGPNGQYVASHDLQHLPREQRYNPWGGRDPFQHMDFTRVRVAHAPWFAITDRHGNNCAYIDLNRITSEQGQAFEEALQNQGVEYEIRRTGLRGGTNVIAVSGEALTELNRIALSYAPWTLVRDRNGIRNSYFDLNEMTSQQRTFLEEALREQNIDYEIRATSWNGGTNVIAVNGDHLRNLNHIRDVYYNNPDSMRLPPAGSGHRAAVAADDIASPGVLARIGRIASLATRAMPAVAAAGVGLEIYTLDSTAHAAMIEGHLSPEGFAAYQGVLAAHAGQASLDPSVVGGEAATVELYEAWQAEFDPDETLGLRPGFLSHLVDFGGRVELTPEQLEFFELFDHIPTEVSDDMPPEMITLVEMKAVMIESQMRIDDITLQAGTYEFVNGLNQERVQLQAVIEQAEEQYAEQYDVLMENGSMEEVFAYLVETGSSIVAQTDQEPQEPVETTVESDPTIPQPGM